MALQSLCETAPEMIIVTHVPWTERYERAEEEIERVIFDGRVIGLKTVSVGEPGYEIVVWNETENDETYGLYSVIRIFARDLESVTAGICSVSTMAKTRLRRSSKLKMQRGNT